MRYASRFLPCLLALSLLGGGPAPAQNPATPPLRAKTPTPAVDTARVDLADTVLTLKAEQQGHKQQSDSLTLKIKGLESTIAHQEYVENILLAVAAVLLLALIAVVAWMLIRAKKREAQKAMMQPSSGDTDGAGAREAPQKGKNKNTEQLKKAENENKELASQKARLERENKDMAQKLQEREAESKNLQAHVAALETNSFYRFDAFEKFTSDADKCLALLEKAEAFARQQALNWPTGTAVGPAQALACHAARADKNQENASKWDSILQVMKKRKGAIYDPHLISDMRNRTSDEAKTSELKKEFFRQAFMHRCGSTLIMLEECRFLATTNSAPGTLPLKFAEHIMDIRAQVRAALGMDMGHVQLGDKASAHTALKNSPEQLRPYLQDLYKDAPAGHIVQVVSIGARGETIVLQEDEQKTQVVIKQ